MELCRRRAASLWNNGTCLGYGRGQKPNAAEFEFRRDVDYCSGAFLMISRELFTKLGGLDEAFVPAYYEETDLCMRIRAAGYRILYEPSIEISHFEFGSSSFSDAAPALQRNFQIFKKRHGNRLSRYHYPPGSSLLKARSASAAPRILVIEDRAPYPYLGAGYPRAAELLETIHSYGWFITFYPLLIPNVEIEAARDFFPAGVEFAPDRGVAGLADFLHQRIDYYDAVLVSRPHNMKIFQKACAQVAGFTKSTSIIYDAEAVYAHREKLRLAVLDKPWSTAAHEEALAEEIDLTKGVRSILAVSEREKSFFDRCTWAKKYILGHGIAAAPLTRPFSERRDILFVGALNGSRKTSPNIDSLFGLCGR